jgi:hypothetical protein
LSSSRSSPSSRCRRLHLISECGSTDEQAGSNLFIRAYATALNWKRLRRNLPVWRSFASNGNRCQHAPLKRRLARWLGISEDSLRDSADTLRVGDHVDLDDPWTSSTAAQETSNK